MIARVQTGIPYGLVGTVETVYGERLTGTIVVDASIEFGAVVRVWIVAFLSTMDGAGREGAGRCGVDRLDCGRAQWC